MQYIAINNKDLEAGYSTYVLQKQSDRVYFFAYRGDTAIGADEHGQEINAYNRGYFLRKGFADAIQQADPKILEPVYKDNSNNVVVPKSQEEAINMIYDGKLNISGFKFVKGVSNEQKEEAFGKLVNCFVATSRNLDFASEKNLFLVQGNLRQVAYNNGGLSGVKIEGAEVQEKLGLRTRDVAVLQKRRAMLAQAKTQIL